ncbi:MAG: dihydroneopterin aldolase [Chlorobiaceae bacterium]|nr:dihydroneopterin aldolase [Chlorobiaceae bacterium]MBA4309966.1 dihydroneopterin aldolase [Chlorobiaceae bacterium]
MTNIIRIKKASFYGYHGVFKQEQNVGGKFEADVDLYTDFSNVSEFDNLKNTIDYEKVYSLILSISVSQKFYLIETLTNKIVDELFFHFEKIDKIALRVRKNNPPIGGVVDSVEVEVIKTREEYLRK